MAKVEDCPGFETFGADVKAAREAKRLARKTLAEMVGIEWRYLANIENQGAIPSLPEEYLPIIEGAIDGALKMEQTAKQKEDA